MREKRYSTNLSYTASPGSDPWNGRPSRRARPRPEALILLPDFAPRGLLQLLRRLNLWSTLADSGEQLSGLNRAHGICGLRPVHRVTTPAGSGQRPAGVLLSSCCFQGRSLLLLHLALFQRTLTGPGRTTLNQPKVYRAREL
ncbi:hypothetical protein Emed_006364 [Eimeria media]